MDNNNYYFKINSITMNDGTIIEPKKINILIGSNSSGKSRFLKDIKDNLNGNERQITMKRIEYNLPLNLKVFLETTNIEDKILMNESNELIIKNFNGLQTNTINLTEQIENFLTTYNFNLNADWKTELQNIIMMMNKKNKAKEFKNIKIKNFIKYSSFYLSDIFLSKTNYMSSLSNVELFKTNYSLYNFITNYGQLFYFYIGTEEKLLLTKRQKRYGIDSGYVNLLSELQYHIKDMKTLSKVVYENFNKYIFLDRTSFGDSLAVRVSDDFDFYENVKYDNSEFELKINKYPLLDDEGDGIKNFVNTYLSLKSNDKTILLLDEPESFLHPPLAYNLGTIIGKMLLKEEKKQIFISTHSEDIINGIVSNVPSKYINIIHIDRIDNKNICSVMNYENLLKLKREPIITMSNIMKGFFTKKVYVTESFSDSIIYSSLLSKYNKLKDYYFVNTESKDKIATVLSLYDSIGICSIGIYDFDFFRNENTIKTCLKTRINDNKIYDKIYNIFLKCRLYLDKKAENEIIKKSTIDKKEFDSMKKELKDRYYHEMGIDSIDDSELREELIMCIDNIKKYNVYILKSGCLETILKNVGLDYSSNKPSWLNSSLSFIENMSLEDIEKLEIIDLFF